ncbi:MAG: undecaprenyldiphospho-muramoylpentapeptide beta-N-acetylglucosaminyltransferase [Bacilli bacterium]|nr:undecaprenyldiphospho-muramoylpentapeptide beta-N-acetylglucosaminyltransferase [Bacilli bacterium]
MRVVVSAGGTGGHIYPALAIINKIKEKEPNSEFLYIGTHDRMENTIVPAHHIPFKQLEIYGFYRKKIYKNGKTIYCFLKAIKKSKKILKDFKPDVVIGVGGYVTAPVIYAAHKLKIKTFIHEQNSIPGASNLFLSKYVDKIGVSFPDSINSFPKEKTIFTGNPCSEDAVKKTPMDKKEFGLHKDKKLILIVMGSLGASTINQFLVETLNQFKNKSYEVLFVTGKKDYDEISKNNFPRNVKVVPYIENMTRIMKNTDLMVTRAGASTLSEIIALHIPSILIPSPYVPNNHQYKNALALTEKEAAILLEEKDLKGDALVKAIDFVIDDNAKQRRMKEQLKDLDIPDSATRIVNCIQDLIDRK